VELGITPGAKIETLRRKILNQRPDAASIRDALNTRIAKGQLTHGKAAMAISEPQLPDKPSIAVLPFSNLSSDPDQEYFADSIVEEMITALSRFDGLFVIARNSTFVYKGLSVDVKQIGRELGVHYVLEGSVRKSGNRVRIAGRLIDASTGTHLWANRFDGGLEDLFDLQDKVTANVVAAIAPKLENAEIARSRRKPTENLDAYDYYLRGIAALNIRSRESSEEALTHFYQAIALDPSYATVHGVAARCYVFRRSGHWAKEYAREMAEAMRLARRAVELGPDDAVALCMAGFALSDIGGDAIAGDALCERALVLNPNLAAAWLFSGWSKVVLGDPDVAIERVSHAMRLSPRDSQIASMHNAIACAHFVAGRYDEALTRAEMAILERPDYIFQASIAAASAALAGRPEKARKAMARLLQIDAGVRISNLSEWGQVFLRKEDSGRLVEGLRKAGLPR
jgi:TolB-like protein/Tfp pilus assembly protein PilF